MKLEEIQNIKNRNIVCIDFDDCLIPWSKFNEKEDFIKTKNDTIRNIELLNKFINETGFEPFITSSWSMVLNDNLEFDNEWEPIHYELLNIVKNGINYIGKDPFGDRILAVEVLLENGNNIIGIDDMDYSSYFPNEFENKQFFMINLYNGINFEKKLNEAKKFFNIG